MTSPTFRDAQAAFDDAIQSGRLSADRQAPNFAGLYMYMGTVAGVDQFKHIDTRRYLPALVVMGALMPSSAWAHIDHVIHAHDATGFAVAVVAVLVVFLIWTTRHDH